MKKNRLYKNGEVPSAFTVNLSCDEESVMCEHEFKTLREAQIPPKGLNTIKPGTSLRPVWNRDIVKPQEVQKRNVVRDSTAGLGIKEKEFPAETASLTSLYNYLAPWNAVEAKAATRRR